MSSNNQLKEELQVLLEGNKIDYANEHIRIIEMVLKIENKRALKMLCALTKSVLKKVNSID